MPGDPSRLDVRALVGDIETNYVPIKSIHDAKGVVTLSSDWDVSPVNPFIGMSNALRRDPQSVDLKVNTFQNTSRNDVTGRKPGLVGLNLIQC
jgi:predicted amidohydrolase YtcJ